MGNEIPVWWYCSYISQGQIRGTVLSSYWLYACVGGQSCFMPETHKKKKKEIYTHIHIYTYIHLNIQMS